MDKQSRMFMSTIKAGVVVTVAAVCFSSKASAQECAGYEALEPVLLREINARLPFEEEISRLKTLVVHNVDELEISGCNVAMNAQVTLKRSVRRNATGHIHLTGRVSAVDVASRSACLSDINVDEVNVSNTLRIGENRYRRAFNRKFDSLCVSRSGVDFGATSCAEAVQGRIAWDYSGSTGWNSANVERLCRGAETSSQPAQCFQQVMHGGVNWGGGTRWQWGNAIDLCEGTNSASNTVSCFRSRISSGLDWIGAIRECGVG